jgi:hypothetical protein
MDSIVVLIFLLIFLVIITLLGHGIWVALRWFIRQLAGSAKSEPEEEKPALAQCPRCRAAFPPHKTFCGYCGTRRPIGVVVELLKDLAATERQVERFQRAGLINGAVYEDLKQKIAAEKTRLTQRDTAPFVPAEAQPQPPAKVEPPLIRTPPVSVVEAAVDETPLTVTPPSVVVVSESSHTGSVRGYSSDAPTFKAPTGVQSEPAPSSYARASAAPPKAEPHRPFTEVLAAFMEQSNIRWGEIIGGLLIIGCSTALVVSLWAQISRIPVLKFIIFTTVTAALFGIGLYTAHRWKLPTTSRGILTIATLLVPLNFLAIAAVSGGAVPPGVLVIGSELVAPALFLCLVYFAGRVITPLWPHVLAAGVLGSSVGQLLIRHFAAPDNSPAWLLALGAFPILCYVGTTAWMLWTALADKEIDEDETVGIVTTLGALTFAALLPFGLLLYKSGPVSMSMMYLAPLVTLGGVPMLASGTLLWQRVRHKDLAAYRTAGASMAILALMMLLSGIVLAWPNPASIVPAALLSFAVFTVLAVWLELPPAQLIGAGCLALAYLVLFQVAVGRIDWQNLRVTSLVDAINHVSTGQALAGPFVVFLLVAEWLRKKKRTADSSWYVVAGCIAAVISLLFITSYGFGISGDPHSVWLLYLLYAIGGAWIGWRHALAAVTLVGAALLLLAIGQGLGPALEISFPWQAALLVHASLCALAAIVFARSDRTRKGLSAPLNAASLITSFLMVGYVVIAGLVLLDADREWQATPQLTQRLFWLAGIWLALLWLNRNRALFSAFQICLTLALVLATKSFLQQFDWYAYLPFASLHPWSLQIQGVQLLVASLAWAGLRFLVRADRVTNTEEGGDTERSWLKDIRHLLNAQVSFDRMVLWSVLVAFVLLTIYGALAGVKQELTARGSASPVWDIAGFPHQLALGTGSWIVLGLLVLALLVNLRQQRRVIYLLGTVVALAAACPLLAGFWEPEVATASAWRWLAAIFLVFASLPLWFRERWCSTNFGLSLLGLASDQGDERQTEVCRTMRVLILALTLVPLLFLTAYPALRSIFYMPVHGPSAGIFHALDDTLSYGIPLVIAALALIAYALRERLVTYAFAAGLLFNVSVTMAYLLSVVLVRGSMDRVVSARVMQLNALTSAVYALVWLSWRRRWLRKVSDELAGQAAALLNFQVVIACVANALVIAPVALRLADQPGWAGSGTFAAGSVTGWLAFGAATAALIWTVTVHRRLINAYGFGAVLLGAGCLVAFTTARWNPAEWSGFHALISTAAIAGGLMCLSRSLPSLVERNALGFISSFFERAGKPQFAVNWSRQTAVVAGALGVLTVLLALRGAIDDPTGSWWSVGALLSISALAAALNWQTLQRRFLYAAGILFSVAASIWWINHRVFRAPDVSGFLKINVSALCLSSLVWLTLELRARRISGPGKSTAASFHNLAALWSLTMMGGIVLLQLVVHVFVIPTSPIGATDWLALTSLLVLMFACIWDGHAKYAVAGVYLTGLLVLLMALDQMALTMQQLAWALALGFAVYAIATSALWRQREKIIASAASLRVPQRIALHAPLAWLVAFNVGLIALVTVLSFVIDLTLPETILRLTAALAVILQLLTFSLLAPAEQKQGWRKAAFAMFAVGAVLFGWAWLVPGVTGTWLNRSMILMVEMFAIVALLGLKLDQALEREPEWTRAIRDCAPWLTGTGVVALIFVLCTEVFYQVEFGAVRVNPLGLVVTGITLASVSIICVLFALSPRHDPLNLPEQRRRNYVYVAELMLALLFMHIRLTMPWLFTGFFERYWPVVVVGIAYVGVVTSEMLRRRGVLVLAHPIERTGVFLPLLPVIGFWLTQPQVDYSVLLFIVGGLYGLLSILRKSFVFGILAVVAGNGGLWYLWHRTEDYGLLQHPQLWLIPAACSVLIAAWLNRKDFSEEQMTGIRYLALVTIYASSTADIFINGVARSPWLPLILAALSLGGVFGGIVLRIRAFLLLGAIFLLLAITTMIYYASVNFGWTWLWYVAGIVTGAMIIFTFALFEKKRDEMLRVVEGLREWQQ